MGPFDRMFDRDGDGELDAFERASQMDFMDRMNHEGLYADDSSSDDFYDDIDSDFNSDYDSGFDGDF